MTRRATFTQAELARAIRAAAKAGKVAVQTRAGIAFLDPANIVQGVADDEARVNTCDEAFGTAARP